MKPCIHQVYSSIYQESNKPLPCEYLFKAVPKKLKKYLEKHNLLRMDNRINKITIDRTNETFQPKPDLPPMYLHIIKLEMYSYLDQHDWVGPDNPTMNDLINDKNWKKID